MTTAQMMSKMKRASGTPAISGIIARVIGTAPRSPTQLIYAISRLLYEGNQQRPVATAKGRATRMRKPAMMSADKPVSSRRLGVTSKPSTRNMVACASQAKPSITLKICSLAGLRELPMRMPAI